MTDLRSLTYEKLCEEVKAMGLPAFRGKQIYEWLHQKRAMSYDEMTNLPSALRETGRGGVAASPTAVAFRENFFGKQA